MELRSELSIQRTDVIGVRTSFDNTLGTVLNEKLPVKLGNKRSG